MSIKSIGLESWKGDLTSVSTCESTVSIKAQFLRVATQALTQTVDSQRSWT
jgi:hypothetical protein